MRRWPDVVDVLDAPVTPGYGGQSVRDWSAATRRTTRAVVSPPSSQDDTTGRDTTVATWRVRLPVSDPITPLSRVEWDGLVLEVEGEIERHARTRHRGHVAANLRVARDR